MRIGMFSDAYLPQISGVVTSIMVLTNELRKKGHTVYIITTEHKDVKVEKDPFVVRLKGINVPLKGFKDYQLVMHAEKKYEEEIEKLELDVIHINTEFTIGRLGLSLAKKNNIPVIYTVHTMYEDYMHFVIPFGKKLLRRPYISYVKKYMKKFCDASKYVILPNEKVVSIINKYQINCNYEIIPTGLYLDKFNKENYNYNDILNIKDKYGIKNELVFIYVGRISKEKSIDVLITEFSKLENDDVKFLIVGDGPAKKDLVHLAKVKEKKGRIIFTGQVPWDEVGLYYQVGDIFLNASKTETQGLTYIEALASNLPVIVKYDTNLDSIVTNNQNGLFYNNNDEIIDCMKKVIEDVDFRNQLINNSRESVYKFSSEAFGSKVEELYNKSIKQE